MALDLLLESGGPILLEAGGPVLLELQPYVVIVVPPSGRWCPAWDMSFFATNVRRLRPILGEAGFTINFVTPWSDNWPWGMTFTKPSGETLKVDEVNLGFGLPIPQFSESGFVWYTFQPGDLDEAGRWYVSLTAGSGLGYFYVALPPPRHP